MARALARSLSVGHDLSDTRIRLTTSKTTRVCIFRRQDSRLVAAGFHDKLLSTGSQAFVRVDTFEVRRRVSLQGVKLFPQLA